MGEELCDNYDTFEKYLHRMLTNWNQEYLSRQII